MKECHQVTVGRTLELILAAESVFWNVERNEGVMLGDMFWLFPENRTNTIVMHFRYGEIKILL